jgi:arylsulfatase A-like enzyme
VTSRAIKRLGEFAESGEQFHLRVNHRGPHYPYVAPEPYASMYDPDEIDPWPSYEEDFTGKPAIHERHSAYRFPGGHGDWRDRWAEAVAKYHGFLTFLDDQFGRLLDALEDCGLADQTVVVHAADHGDFAGGHRQFNKGPLMYEDTYRVPLLVRWPGVTDGGVRDEFVVLQDLMPTFCDLGGADAPDSTHSRSLVPLLRDEVDDWRDQVVSEYHGDEFGLYSQRMVRWDDYKFVFNYPDRNELYDLGADPHELENRIDDPEYADVTAEGAERLREWMDATGDPNARWGGQILDL